MLTLHYHTSVTTMGKDQQGTSRPSRDGISLSIKFVYFVYWEPNTFRWSTPNGYSPGRGWTWTSAVTVVRFDLVTFAWKFLETLVISSIVHVSGKLLNWEFNRWHGSVVFPQVTWLTFRTNLLRKTLKNTSLGRNSLQDTPSKRLNKFKKF